MHRHDDVTRFPAECRQFLRRLAESTDGAAAPAHASECASCHGLWMAARRHAAVLSTLQRPSLPAAAQTPEFLAGIYQRAAESSEARMGEVLRVGISPSAAPDTAAAPAFLDGVYARSSELSEDRLGEVLRAGLEPVPAPADAVWLDVTDRADVASSLRGLPAARTPGWMRKRIRAAIEGESTSMPHEPVFTRARVGLLAAALLISGLLFVRVGPGDGTHRLEPSAEFDVRFEVSSEPFDPAFSLDGLLVGR